VSDSPLAMGKSVAEIHEINAAAIRVALAALYDTHIEDPYAAMLRGTAIQAIARLADFLGIEGLIPEIERTPASKRRRESPLWRK